MYRVRWIYNDWTKIGSGQPVGEVTAKVWAFAMNEKYRGVIFHWVEEVV
jgi:hypothetical protein